MRLGLLCFNIHTARYLSPSSFPFDDRWCGPKRDLPVYC